MSPTPFAAIAESIAKAHKPAQSAAPAAESTDRLALVDISPELAADWLKHNKANRNVRQMRVSQYAEDMKADNWRLTGESIKFDTNDELVDGQHRLLAIIAADKTVQMPVVFGLEPDVRRFVDTGAARTASDALRMQGEPAAAILGAAARLGILAERNLNNAPISHAQVFAYIDEHPRIKDSSVWVQSHLKKVDLQPSVQAYTHFRCSEVDPYAADEFFMKLYELNSLASDDPILRLAHRLRQADRNGEKPDKRILVNTVLRTWNSWRRGQSMMRVLLASPEAPLPDLV